MRGVGLLENLGKQMFSSLIVASFQVEIETLFQAGAMASASFFSVFLDCRRSQASSVQAFLFVSIKGIFRLALKKALMQLFKVLRIQLWL